MVPTEINLLMVNRNAHYTLKIMLYKHNEYSVTSKVRYAPHIIADVKLCKEEQWPKNYKNENIIFVPIYSDLVCKWGSFPILFCLYNVKATRLIDMLEDNDVNNVKIGWCSIATLEVITSLTQRHSIVQLPQIPRMPKCTIKCQTIHP